MAYFQTLASFRCLPARQHRTDRSEHSTANRRQHGFSLIELLVVVAILAILAAVAIPLFLNQKKKAADGVVVSELKTLVSDVSSGLVVDTAVVSAGADGNPASNSGNVTIDGVSIPKNGAGVFVNTGTNPKQWCVSRQSSSGRVFAASNVAGVPSRGVYEAQNLCTSGTSFPQSGTNSGGVIVSAAGNLLTAAQASFEDGSTGGWTTHTRSTVANSTDIAGHNGTKTLKVTTSAGGTYAQIWIPATPGTAPVAGIPIIPNGTPVTFVSYIYTSSPGLRASVYGIMGGSAITLVNLTPNSWTRVSNTFVSNGFGNYPYLYISRVDGADIGSETFYVDGMGFWTGTGGQWALPGNPIYQ